MTPAPDESAPGDGAPSSNERAAHGRRWISWCVAVVAFPTLYVLSAGPMLLLASQFPNGPIWWMRAYAPLFWLQQHVSLSQAPLNWYIGLWIPS